MKNSELILATKDFIETNSRLLLKIYSIALILLGIFEIYMGVFVLPVSNDECLWTPIKVGDKTTLVFQKVKVNGVTWRAGIRDGDILLAIGNTPLASEGHATNLLNKYKIGDYAEYTIKRKSEIIKTKVLVKKLIQFNNLAFTVLGFIWVLIASIVYLSRTKGKVQKAFFNIGAFFLIYFSFTILNYLFTNIVINVSLQLLILLPIVYAALRLPFELLKLFLLFPFESSIFNKKWAEKSFHYVPNVLFLIFSFYLLFAKIFNYNLLFINTVLNSSLNLSYFSAIAGLIILIIKYFKLDKDSKKPVGIIIVSFLLSILAIVYTIYIAPQIADTFFNSPEFYTPILLIVVLPLSFAYSIFKYQLFDVSVVLKNAIVYATATISVAAIYFISIYVLGQTISTAIGTEYKGIIAGLCFVVFSMVFQKTKDNFVDLLTKKFYPEQFAYQKILVDFSNQVSTILGLSNIFASLQNIFTENLKVSNFAIYLKVNDNKLRLATSTENEKFPLEIDFEENSITSLTKNVKRDYLKLVIEKQEFGKYFDFDINDINTMGIYSIIPLMYHNKLVGMMMVGLKYSGSVFAGKDLELLTACANQTAVAIENARLYESEAQRLSLEKELDNARRIQQSLLPQNLPLLKDSDIYGLMIPAMHVGGDYYDVIPINENHYYLVVADVSGKGLHTALYMSKLQTMLKLYCNYKLSPREILVEVNNQLCNTLEKGYFITATLCEVNISNKKIKFCRAGHLPYLFVNNGKVEEVLTKGIGLGLRQGSTFNSSIEERELEIKNGDVVVLYSDGVSEAQNADREEFSTNKLKKVLEESQYSNSQQIAEKILNEISQFRGTALQNDDITILIAGFE